MKQYLDALKDILENGYEKKPARENMPSTIELNGLRMVFDLQKGFPILTTKKMYWKGIVGELLWFLKGETNIKYLVENNIHIWDDDAYRYYLNIFGRDEDSNFLLNKEEFLESVLGEETVKDENGQVLYTFGDCGKIYGYQWRSWEGWVDQIGRLLMSIRENPDSRYHLVTAWNPSHFIAMKNEAALPACHMMFQCFVREGKYLDMTMYQRSCDFFLGVPFNISSYSLLLTMLAQATGYQPGKFTWLGGSCHIYSNHIEQVKEQLSREPLELPKLVMNNENEELIYNISDFELEGYQYHPAIKAQLSTGLQK